jgi:hypothetical protein
MYDSGDVIPRWCNVHIYIYSLCLHFQQPQHLVQFMPTYSVPLCLCHLPFPFTWNRTVWPNARVIIHIEQFTKVVLSRVSVALTSDSVKDTWKNPYRHLLIQNGGHISHQAQKRSNVLWIKICVVCRHVVGGRVISLIVRECPRFNVK